MSSSNADHPRPPPFPLGQFGVIYADPPWAYEMRSDKGHKKSPHAHYDCMSIEQLKSLRDQILWASGTHCICIMWTTFAFLDQSLDLLDSWGFKYKTGGPWVKRSKNGNPSFGTGYVFRSAAELFLIGTQGSPKIKNKSTRNLILTGDWPADVGSIDSIIVDSLRREHSRKPDDMASMIEALFEGPYLELFARTERPGWSVWGNQTDQFTTSDALDGEGC